MARILHFADLHLDTTFASVATSGLDGYRPRQALRDCLRRIVDLALEREVDLVTIAGDLYEHGRRTSDTANFLRGELARLDPIRVLIAPGNHDPFTPESLYRAGSWPSNVAIADTPQLRPYWFDGDIEVWAAAFTAPWRSDSPLEGFSLPPAGGRKRLLLLHASTIEGDNNYCPVDPARIQSCGFDAALLGHIHDSRYSRPADGVYYPGSPEPLGFGEEGLHHVLVLDTDGESIAIEPVPVNRMCFGTLRIDVTGMDNSEQVRGEIVEQTVSEGLSGAIIRVRLEGDQHPDIDLDADGLLSSLIQSPALFVDLADNSRPSYDFAVEAQGYNTKARFVRAMLSRISTEEDPLARAIHEEALVLGLRAFEGRRLSPRQQARTREAE